MLVFISSYSANSCHKCTETTTGLYISRAAVFVSSNTFSGESDWRISNTCYCNSTLVENL